MNEECGRQRTENFPRSHDSVKKWQRNVIPKPKTLDIVLPPMFSTWSTNTTIGWGKSPWLIPPKIRLEWHSNGGPLPMHSSGNNWPSEKSFENPLDLTVDLHVQALTVIHFEKLPISGRHGSAPDSPFQANVFSKTASFCAFWFLVCWTKK